MRCFLAIELPEEIKQELVRLQGKLRESMQGIKASFVKPENLHITLKFFGELSDAQINKLKATLKELSFEPFKLKLDSLGSFPTGRAIRVIWAGLEPADQLLNLFQKIESSLAGKGFRKDRSFTGHITLARIKWAKGAARAALQQKLQTLKPKPLEFEVKGFVLKKSTLTREGPIYEDIVGFPIPHS